MDPWHFRKYKKKLEQKRDRDRKDDIPTGGHIICPGSYATGGSGDGLIGVHTCQVYRRPSKKVEGKFSTFASCDKCGIGFRLWGDGWTHGARPIFSMDEAQATQLMKVITGVMAEMEKIWQRELMEAKVQASTTMTMTTHSLESESQQKSDKMKS